MTFLPIVERELRVAARRPATYWLRLAVAFGMIVIAGWVFLASGSLAQNRLGQIIFYALTGGLMLYCLMAGMRSTADCLSEEKRDGTLGLLFLTDLRGYEVVFGKFAANSLATFYCLLAVVPVLTLCILLGGVTITEIGRIALVLLNTAFLSLSAGMLASAFCKQSRTAILCTFLLVLLPTAVSPGLGMALWGLAKWQGEFPFVFLLPSPVFSYFTAMDTLFVARKINAGFYVSLGLAHGLAWLFLVAAGRRVRHSWQDKVATAEAARRQELLRAKVEGNHHERNSFRSRTLDRNAYFWLATRPRLRPFLSWLPLLTAAGIWIWGMLKFRHEWFDAAIYLATGFLLSSVMKGHIAAEAGRRLTEDRKLGALELILSTPLPVREILRGQRLALLRQFLGPVVVFFMIALLLMANGLNLPGMSSPEDRGIWLGVWIGGLFMFIADVVALYWMGMWTGLSTRNPKHAYGATVTPVLALPWVLFAAVLTIYSLFHSTLRHVFNWAGWPIILWLGLGLVTDIFLILLARHNLLTHFRTLAAQRYEPKRSLWQRVFGRA